MALNFTVWIDADSCPIRVREFVISYTSKKEIPINFVANHEIPAKNKTNLFKMIICPQTEGAADDYILQNVKPNDFVITRDIPFAAKLVDKKITAINDRGTSFTKDNIHEKLSERNFNLNLAMLGFGNDKKSNYSDKDFKKFTACFDREIQKNIVNDMYNLK